MTMKCAQKTPCCPPLSSNLEKEAGFSYKIQKNDKKHILKLSLTWRDIELTLLQTRLSDILSQSNLTVKIEETKQYANHEHSISVCLDTKGQTFSDQKLLDLIHALSCIHWAREDQIEHILIRTKIVTHRFGELLRAIASWIHQFLADTDSPMCSLESIEDTFCKFPELSKKLCDLFALKFDLSMNDINRFHCLKSIFHNDVEAINTEQEHENSRHKIIFRQALNFISSILKTNFYRLGDPTLSFRLDSSYFDALPFNRTEKFPELPYGIFFIKGIHFFGFHVRFKDLARGGIRTICPESYEQMINERNHVFSECYHLAYTQQKKNKDIPEGGAKGVIFLETYPTTSVKSDALYRAQRHFIEGLLHLVNCHADGTIRTKHIVDYWKRPEYLYLGPDENMHDSMIEWIAKKSKKMRYKPGSAFISSKPSLGINHKEYGVTSLGVNVYLRKTLEYFGINPTKDLFTVKMTGGPDGDVAGNQLLNLLRDYPQTAKVVALTDGSGTIRDEKGLDLRAIKTLFERGEAISDYPLELLSSGGFLIHRKNRRASVSQTQEVLCHKKIGEKIVPEWLSADEASYLLKTNVHKAHANVFIPAGGRPKTLNKNNIQEFLDDKGKPTSQIIVEGANLYLDHEARTILEDKGVLIIKDSSANKGGVICSSFEVLTGLTLSDEHFLKHKNQIVSEILERIRFLAEEEADLLLQTHKKTDIPLTLLSEQISKQINNFTYELLDYLESLSISLDAKHPLIHIFLNFALPTLQKHFRKELIRKIPSYHKKAIIACYLASSTIYRQKIWSSSNDDLLSQIKQNLNSALNKIEC